MSTDHGYALSWDSEIKEDYVLFELLPEGEYEFTVMNFERGQHNGSEKLPPCPKATLYLRIDDQAGSTTIQHNLFLHSRCEKFLSGFFASLGQKQIGAKATMDWGKVIGAKGRAVIKIESFTRQDGSEGQSNKIKRFIDPSEPKNPWQQKWEGGKF